MILSLIRYRSCLICRKNGFILAVRELIDCSSYYCKSQFFYMCSGIDQYVTFLEISLLVEQSLSTFSRYTFSDTEYHIKTIIVKSGCFQHRSKSPQTLKAILICSYVNILKEVVSYAGGFLWTHLFVYILVKDRMSRQNNRRSNAFYLTLCLINVSLRRKNLFQEI